MVGVCIVEDVKEIYFIWNKAFPNMGNSLYSVQYIILTTPYLYSSFCQNSFVTFHLRHRRVQFTVEASLSLHMFLCLVCVLNARVCFNLPPWDPLYTFARIVFWLASYFFMNKLAERASLIRAKPGVFLWFIRCYCNYLPIVTILYS